VRNRSKLRIGPGFLTLRLLSHADVQTASEDGPQHLEVFHGCPPGNSRRGGGHFRWSRRSRRAHPGWHACTASPLLLCGIEHRRRYPRDFALLRVATSRESKLRTHRAAAAVRRTPRARGIAGRIFPSSRGRPIWFDARYVSRSLNVHGLAKDLNDNNYFSVYLTTQGPATISSQVASYKPGGETDGTHIPAWSLSRSREGRSFVEATATLWLSNRPGHMPNGHTHVPPLSC
jgi:hypothetical protein